MWGIWRVGLFIIKNKKLFRHVINISVVLESLLRTKISLVLGSLLSVYVQSIAKLYSVLLSKYEAEADWDNIDSLDNLMLSKLPEFQYTDHLEAQERVDFFFI